MTVKECYSLLNGNYDDVMGRLLTEARVQKYMLKFIDEGTMQKLRDSLAAEDYQQAFEAAHTLKGVTANVSFTGLYDAVYDLTEALRAEKKAPDANLVKRVEDEYTHTIEILNRFKSEM